MSLTPTLLAHLAAARNPDDPGFAHAVEALGQLDLQSFAKDDLPTLIAMLDAAIGAVEAHKNTAGTELDALRNRAALNAYTQRR